MTLTQYGSPPKSVTPGSLLGVGLGFSSTSSEGPRYILIPSAASSLPMTAPVCLASSGDQVAPTAISDGRDVSPLRIWSPGGPSPSCARAIKSGTYWCGTTWPVRESEGGLTVELNSTCCRLLVSW